MPPLASNIGWFEGAVSAPCQALAKDALLPDDVTATAPRALQLIDISDEPLSQPQPQPQPTDHARLGGAALGVPRDAGERQADERPASHYHMDNCMCHLEKHQVLEKLRQAFLGVPGMFELMAPPTARAQGVVPPPAPDASALLAACGCPMCGAALSHQDMRQLLGRDVMLRVYRCVADHLMQRTLPGGNSGAAGAAPTAAPACAMCSGRAMVHRDQVAAASAVATGMHPLLPKADEGTSRAVGPAPCEPLRRAALKEALAARGLPALGNVSALADRLLAALTASDTTWFCAGCAASVPSQSRAPRRSLQPHGSGADGSLASLVASLRAQLTGSRPGSGADAAAESTPAMFGGAGGRGACGRGRWQPANGRGHGRNSQSWSKGTGYGGPTGNERAAVLACQQAKQLPCCMLTVWPACTHVRMSAGE